MGLLFLNTLWLIYTVKGCVGGVIFIGTKRGTLEAELCPSHLCSLYSETLENNMNLFLFHYGLNSRVDLAI